MYKYLIVGSLIVLMGLVESTFKPKVSATPTESVERYFDQDKTNLRNYMAKYSVKVMGLQGGHGSGFQITHEGRNYILTNKHVCEMAIGGKIGVKYDSMDFHYIVYVQKVSDKHDLCLVESPAQYVKSGLSIAKSLKSGDYVAIFGYPHDLPGTYSDGMYSGDVTLEWVDEFTPACTGRKETRVIFDIFNGNDPFQQVDVCITELLSGVVTSTIYPGNSGSPVVNKNGEVVGVAYAGRPGVIFANYMVPLQFVQEFIEGI